MGAEGMSNVEWRISNVEAALKPKVLHFSLALMVNEVEGGQNTCNFRLNLLIIKREGVAVLLTQTDRWSV
jgi:hypothetical protein